MNTTRENNDDVTIEKYNRTYAKGCLYINLDNIILVTAKGVPDKEFSCMEISGL